MPNTRVSSRTALSHMQPLARRHDGIPRNFTKDTAPSFTRSVGSPEETHWACIIFNIKRGAGESQCGFLQRFHPLLYGKLSYLSGAVKLWSSVPGIRTSPIIRQVTAGLLSVIGCTFHVGMEGGGGMWGASKAEEKALLHSVPALIRGPRDGNRFTL